MVINKLKYFLFISLNALLRIILWYKMRKLIEILFLFHVVSTETYTCTDESIRIEGRTFCALIPGLHCEQGTYQTQGKGSCL